MIWAYIILSYISLFLFGLLDNLRGPIFPELIGEFGISNTHASWFYATTSIFSFLGSWVCVHTLKKIDRVQNLYLALLLLAMGLFGWSQSHNFTQLLIFSVLTGLGFGLIAVSYNILATVGSHPSKRQRVLSGLHTMYGLSSFVAPLAVAAIYQQGHQWRTVFLLGGFVCLTILFISLVSLRKEKPRELAFEEPTPNGHSAHARPPGIWIVPICFALYVAAEIMIGSRLALYLRLEKGFNLEKSSFYVTGFFLCLLISRFLFSLIHVKIKVHSLLLISLGASAVMMLGGILFHESLLMFTGLTMGPFFAMGIVYLSEVFPGYLNLATSRAMAMQSLFVVLMHMSSGVITDTIGVRQAMLIGPSCLVISFLLLWKFPQWRQRS